MKQLVYTGKKSYLFRLVVNMITSWILPTLIISLIFYHHSGSLLKEDTSDRNDGMLLGAGTAFERSLTLLKADTYSWTITSDSFYTYANQQGAHLNKTSTMLNELRQIAYSHDSVLDLWLYLEPIDYFATQNGSYDVDFFFGNAFQHQLQDHESNAADLKSLLMTPSAFTPLSSSLEYHNNSNHQKQSALMINSTLRNTSGKAVGFLTYLIDPSSFLKAFDVYDMPEGTMMGISNAEHMLTASDPQLMQANTLIHRTSGQILELNGRKYLYNCYHSGLFGWQYIMLYPYSLLVGQLQQLMLLCLGICGCVIAVGSSYVYFISKRLYRPVRNTLDLLTPDMLTPERGTDEFEYINSQLADVLLKNHELESEFITALDVMQQSVIARLLRGEIDPGQAQEIIAKYHIHLPLKYLTIMIVSPKRESADPDAILGRLLESCDYSFVLNSSVSRVVILNAMSPAVPAFTEDDRRNAIAVSASTPVQSLSQLPQAYAQAQFCSRYMRLNVSFEYLDEAVVRERMGADNAAMDFTPFEQPMINALESQNADKALHLLNDRFPQWFDLNLPLRTIEDYAGRMDALCSRCAELLNVDKSMLPPLHDDEKSNPVSAHANIAIRYARMQALLARAGQKQQVAKDRQMQCVLRYIEDNLSEDLSLESVTDSMGISYHALSRYLKQRFGMTFLEYVTAKRMERARKYLLETPMTVDEISRQIGYLSTASFIRNFNKVEGVSPGQYRKIKRKGAENDHDSENS